MGNSRYYQFLYSKTPMLTMISGVVTFGATGAVSTVAGNGVQGVTRLTTGIYEIKLVENYNAYVKSLFRMNNGVTGSNVADGSFSTGTLYQITAVGTTNWASAGFDSDFTPSVGAVFVATGAGGAGTGTAKAIASSLIVGVNLVQSVSGMLQNLNAASGKGSAFVVQTYSATNTLADPANGSQMGFAFFLRNSSVSY